MDRIYYLVHNTNKKPTDFQGNRLGNATCKEATGGQFPGVFMTLVTKKNIKTTSFYPGKYALVFSKELLQQENYHINLMDCNGMVTEKITYYPWNIEKAVSLIDAATYGHSNEVVFHDAIDMTKYLCKVITQPEITPGADVHAYFSYLERGGLGSILPKKEMRTSAPPDRTKRPFYCYTNEDRYDGVPAPPKSSLAWFQLLLKVANAKIIPNTIKECIARLRKKSPHLCQHREKQRIEFIKKHTQGKGYRTQTRRKRKEDSVSPT